MVDDSTGNIRSGEMQCGLKRGSLLAIVSSYGKLGDIGCPAEY
jgi:hypothetical protein